MKKILLTVIIILLVVLSYYTFTKGITLGKVQALSIAQLKEKNEALDLRIEETNRLLDTEYQSRLNDLKIATSRMQQAKKEYLDLTNISTNDQILKATMEESYTIEVLWTRVGRYATSKGVIVEMAVGASDTGTTGLNNLNFTVNGSYIAIVDFIEAIENDSILNFRIRNFKLVPYQEQGAILTATFTVKNIAIEGNTLGQTPQATDTTQSNSENIENIENIENNS